ncbi:hypothetical protein [Staphylococcus pseudoxylosus]|uniref:hypothetical protein n=1 Tax=Staphylococcus pseudoxylosus TaxID=2282419 RepID=UPI002DB68FA0|nr:hypothetical protein [Staphylococcus pseudoxylosus]MEB6038200.1 hypothetical protein [Staphylococcus pseudoxylosus]
MEYLIIGIIIFVIAILIRAVRINQTKSKRNKSTNIIKHIFKFLIKELKAVFLLYTTSIGVYIVIERMLKYRIYPANEEGIYKNLNFIHHMEPNAFVTNVFINMLIMYIAFFLPYKLLKLYGIIINENNYKDYLQIACNKLFVIVKELPNEARENREKRKKQYRNK